MVCADHEIGLGSVHHHYDNLYKTDFLVTCYMLWKNTKVQQISEGVGTKFSAKHNIQYDLFLLT